MSGDTGPTEGELRDLVGYERRLYKMSRDALQDEAYKFSVNTLGLDKNEIVKRILAARGIDDQLLAHPEEGL